jgi:DNA-binding NtrC family response regulator
VNEVVASTLLIVDDESAVCRALRRMLNHKVDRIMTAETPEDAETVLASTIVTHLICDHYLGPGQPLGMDLAATWRTRYPALRQIVVLTGKDVDGIEAASGIDHVLPKTTEPARLAALLRLGCSERG